MGASGYGGLKKGFERAKKENNDWTPGFPKPTPPKPPRMIDKIKSRVKQAVDRPSQEKIAKLKPQIAAQRAKVESARRLKNADSILGIRSKKK